MKHIKANLIVLFLFSFVVDNLAQNYTTLAETISSGGGTITGSNYSNFGVISEPIISSSLSGGVYKNPVGFLNTIGEGEGPNFSLQRLSNIYSVRIYPNPTKNNLNVLLNDVKLSGSNLLIYNNYGQCIYNCTLNSTISEIELPNLNSGIYILKIRKKDMEYSEKMIIK